jgi:phosphatidyl-myo-inositol dimannoside synthase
MATMGADCLAGLCGLNRWVHSHCLALVTDAYGGCGGIAQYNRDLCGALVDCGLAVTVVPRHAPDRAGTPAGVRQAPARHGRLAYALATLHTALRERVDIVFCGHLYLATLAALIAWLKGARLIVQTHGIEAWPRPSRLRRLAAERTDLVLCVSRYTRARVLDWAAIAPERAIVVPDTVGVSFTPGDGSQLRLHLGLDSKRVLLTVGRMDTRERYKGHDRVIAALPSLAALGHDAVYLVLGEGNDRRRLQAYAHSLGVAGGVHFLGGVVADTLVDAYRMADLFVMPSTGEGFGIAYLEAMASGTPALGLAVAGACDALADGELGIAVPEMGDLEAAIATQLAARKPDRRALSTAVRARFGRPAFVARVNTALERLGEAE